MPQVLVTGASGYLGSRLAARLAREGWAVHAVLRPGSDAAPLAGLARLRVFRHDGRTGTLTALARRVRPRAVFHLAAMASYSHGASDVEPLVRANVLFGAQLAEAAAAAGARAFVNAGTFWQRLGGKGYSPVSLYAATKQAFQDVLLYYAEARGLRAATLVLFDVYGPQDPRGKLLAQLLEARRTGRRVDLSPGRQTLDLVHVDDAVEALLAASRLAAAGKLAPGSSYAVDGGRRLTLRELVALLERLGGRKVPVRWGGRPYREREVLRPWKGPRLPGWRPRVRLEDGLRQALSCEP